MAYNNTDPKSKTDKVNVLIYEQAYTRKSAAPVSMTGAAELILFPFFNIDKVY